MAQASGDSFTLLTEQDGPPYRIIPGNGNLPILLVCDHASNRIPARLNNLGLGEEGLGMHFAIDVGAAKVTAQLADMLGATAVMGNFSRLVVDCNRNPDHPQFMTPVEDGVVVPGNQDISVAEREARKREIYDPYHEAVEANIRALEKKHGPVHVLGIHSFTPQYRGAQPRQTQIGIAWNNRNAVAAGMLDSLRKTGLNVGNNKPYALIKANGGIVSYTMSQHVEAPHRSGFMVEIRHNEIQTEPGCQSYAALLAEAIRDNIAPRPTLHEGPKRRVSVLALQPMNA